MFKECPGTRGLQPGIRQCGLSAASESVRLCDEEDPRGCAGFRVYKRSIWGRQNGNPGLRTSYTQRARGKKGAATSAPAETVKKESSRKAVAVIARAIEDADDDGWVNLASVGSRILGATPRFDPTN